MKAEGTTTLYPRTLSRIALVALALALAAPACKKSPKSDAQPSTVAPPSATATEDQGAGELEAEIAKDGPKTVTAVGSEGKTRVVELGKATLADTDTYTVQLDVPDSVGAKADTQMTINVVPKPGWKLNQDFPTKLVVSPPAGVSVKRAEQTPKEAAKFSEKAAAFVVDFNCDSAGDKSFSAKFQFAVCTDATCDPKSENLSWNVKVN